MVRKSCARDADSCGQDGVLNVQLCCTTSTCEWIRKFIACHHRHLESHGMASNPDLQSEQLLNACFGFVQGTR